MEAKVLQPTYLKAFSCIGGACEDTCCSGWNIAIDKKTFKAYKKCKEPLLKERLRKDVLKDTGDYHTYGKMRIIDQHCAFLNEEGLCDIHKTLGPSYLSIVCNNFPKQHSILSTHIEESASLSCPEAARLALLPKEPMEFIFVDDTLQLMRKIVGVKADETTLPIFEGRNLSISILQDRSYSLRERLMILGLLVKNLEENYGEWSQSIFEFTYGLEHHIFEDLPGRSVDSSKASLSILQAFIEVRKRVDISEDKRFTDLYKLFMQGYEQAKEHKALEEYYQTYLDPFMEAHGYMMEHFLVNFVFKTLFPGIEQEKLLPAYSKLVLYYSMIQLLALGQMIALERLLTPEEFLIIIQLIAKKFGHSGDFNTTMVSILEERGFDSVEKVSLLL